jgi:aarF domain-containing kinase
MSPCKNSYDIVSEFDYSGEARNLDEIRRLVLPRWGDKVDIPAPHMDLCSRHLLVMDFIEGIKLVDGIRAQFRALAAQSGDTRPFEDIEKERIQAIRDGTLQLQSIDEAEKQHKSIEWMVYVNDWVLSLNPLRWVFNRTLAPVCAIATQQNYSSWHWKYQLAAPILGGDDASTGPGGSSSTSRLVDLSYLLRLLCDVHASEIFEAGSFNADPHPGNILLMKDGRIGLIDYGQV